MWGTTDGSNFTNYSVNNLLDYDGDPVISGVQIGTNYNFFSIRKGRSSVLGIYNLTGYNMYNYYNQGVGFNHIECVKNTNIIYVCGYKINGSSRYPYLTKSTDAGQTFNALNNFNGSQDQYGVGELWQFCIVNYLGHDILKISGASKLIEYDTYTNSVNEISTPNWAYGRKIYYYDMNNGFYMRNDVADNPEDPPFDAEGPGMFMTTNNGQNWTLDITPNINLGKTGYQNRFYSFGNMVSFIQTAYDGSSYFHKRRLNDSVCTYYDNFKTTGTISINNQNYPTPNYHNFIGGIYPLYSTPIINENQPDEKIFYKWINGEVQNNIQEYNLFYDGKLSAYYKTKFISSAENAISTPSLTKSFIDTNGTINQVHESMEGIFYSRSTDNGNSFSREEVVNREGNGNGNTNAFISEVKQSFTIPQIDAENNVVAVWQRREGNNEVIKLAYRHKDIGIPNSIPIWLINSSCNITVPSSSPFNLQAKGFVQERISGTLHEYFSLIAYLKPNGSNIDLMVTGKYGTNVNNFPIASGNISEFAVTRSSQGYDQVLYFVYIKDNEVWYKSWRFNLNGGPQGSVEDNPTEARSSGDGQILRISPDISLRNGRPIVTYRGMSVIQRWVHFNGGEDYLLNIFNYPIFVRYKYNSSNLGEIWSTRAIYNSAGVEQKYPNIEGCKNGNAYVLNYKYNNQYRQVAYLQSSPGYCSPGQYTVTDAKLVRGSFFGTAYPYSSPMLFTLTQSGSLYNVNKETFTISNIPMANSNLEDNLLGTIREQNLNYNFNLGPVVAKNTNVSFPSELETSIDNPVAFSNTMVSAPFSLGPNDTLIMNGTGNYNYVSGETFTQKRFTVNLMRKSTQGIYLTLFSDSIGVADTIQSEYLRGFVFDENNMPEVDSFYVQMIIDSTSLYFGDGYSVCNVYSPDEIYEGDNYNSHKRYVHFMNGKNNNYVSIPKVYSLSQNYPNPFNPVTNIKYEIPVYGYVLLKIYDITGREIANLVKEYKQAGYYTVSFNGSNFASGIYFYRIQTGDFVQVRKMLMIK